MPFLGEQQIKTSFYFHDRDEADAMLHVFQELLEHGFKFKDTALIACGDNITYADFEDIPQRARSVDKQLIRQEALMKFRGSKDKRIKKIHLEQERDKGDKIPVQLTCGEIEPKSRGRDHNPIEISMRFDEYESRNPANIEKHNQQFIDLVQAVSPSLAGCTIDKPFGCAHTRHKYPNTPLTLPFYFGVNFIANRGFHQLQTLLSKIQSISRIEFDKNIALLPQTAIVEQCQDALITQEINKLIRSSLKKHA